MNDMPNVSLNLAKYEQMQCIYRDLDTTPPLQVRESSGSNFGRLLACLETLCNKHHVREQTDLNPENAGSCICADTCFHAFSGWQPWEPLQQPGKPTQNLVHDNSDYIWKLSTVGLANLTKSCMGLRKGEWQHKLAKWKLNNSNHFTSTGSFLDTNSTDMCPVMRVMGICFQREILFTTGQWILLIGAEIL